MVTEERLAELGLTSAAEQLKSTKELKRKLAIAYEHFRFVKPDNINNFNQKLAKESKRLRFTILKDYKKIPPEDVLDAIERAIGFKCFDSFEVADIIEVKDPIIFGCIKGCEDKFFIAQWDNDVKIEDILKDKEG